MKGGLCDSAWLQLDSFLSSQIVVGAACGTVGSGARSRARFAAPALASQLGPEHIARQLTLAASAPANRRATSHLFHCVGGVQHNRLDPARRGGRRAERGGGAGPARSTPARCSPATSSRSSGCSRWGAAQPRLEPDQLGPAPWTKRRKASTFSIRLTAEERRAIEATASAAGVSDRRPSERGACCW